VPLFREENMGFEVQGGGNDRPPFEWDAAGVSKFISSMLTLGLVFVLVLLAFGSFFQVEPEEEAVVLRFGAPRPEVYGPGLHFKIPLVDRAFVVPVERQHRIEFGFRSEPGKVTTVQDTGWERESLMLTGDLLLVHVRWSVIYKIDDIETWLFVVANQEETIRDIANSVMRQLVGDYSLHELLTVKVRELQDNAMAATQTALRAKVPTGVVITELSIRATDVPSGAKAAFDEFNRTEPDVRRMLAEAKAAQYDVVGDAEQDWKAAIGTAEKEKEQIIKNAEGEAGAFLAQLAEYEQAPEITKQWLYLEAMSTVLTNVDEKIIIDDDGGSGAVKLLPLKNLMGGGK
jgi:membrane protease subunit HflK